MAYRVRTADGELNFGSLYDIERAYAHRLVDEDDDVLEVGTSEWRKVSSLHVVMQARPQPRRGLRVAPVAWAAGGGLAAAYLLLTGRWVPGLVLALLVCALASRITYTTFKR